MTIDTLVTFDNSGRKEHDSTRHHLKLQFRTHLTRDFLIFYEGREKETEIGSDNADAI